MSKQSEINKKIAKLLSQIEKNVNKSVSGYETNIVISYKEAYKRIKSTLAEYVADLGENNLTTAKYIQIEKKLKSIVNDISKGVKTDISDSIRSAYAEAGNFTHFALETATGMNLNFSLLNEKAIRASVLNPVDKIKWSNSLKVNQKKFEKTIINEITQGISTGQSYKTISGNILKTTNIAANKSIRIVRTEAHRVQTIAQLDVFDEVNENDDLFNLIKFWDSTLDGNTRTSHGEVDGQEADENGEFTLPGGIKTEGPGLSNIASEDINCRCSVGYRIAGYSFDKRRDNETKKIIKNQTYSEWKKGKS